MYDYNQVKDDAHVETTVANAFRTLNIKSYPVDIFDVLEQLEFVRVVPYSVFSARFNISTEEVIREFGTEDGCTIYNPRGKRYIIYYNDLDSKLIESSRIRWTLAHELGHISLDHFSKMNVTQLRRRSMTNEKYRILEQEANKFAAYFLAHPSVLSEINIQSKEEVQELCELSKMASKYRYEECVRVRYSYYTPACNDMVLEQFREFISYKIYGNHNYQQVCLKCNSSIKIDSHNFCSVCGNNEFVWRNNYMKYRILELNEFNKAKICPICENEFTNIEGEYCQICGTNITNKCTKCSSELSGDARFCAECGNESTFLKNGVLLTWDKEKDAYDAFNNSSNGIDLFAVTPVDDGDMPF